jgi:hypothetical protein
MLIALGSLPLAGRFSRYFLPQSDRHAGRACLPHRLRPYPPHHCLQFGLKGSMAPEPLAHLVHGEEI